MASPFQEILDDQARLDELTSEVFDRVDTDGSGQVSKSELKAGLTFIAEESGVPLPSDDDITEILTALDTDHSGSLSKAEFKVLLVEVLKALAKA
jgi:Ca2+-binding EF-hand superfamily protein